MNLNKRDKILLSVLALVVAIGGVYWFVVKPAKAEAQANRDELAMLESDTANVRDQLDRLKKERNGEQNRLVAGFQMAKAVPARPQVASAVVQLEDLARKTNVRLTGVRTNNVTSYGPITATELSVLVKGRFFDVDDFMFRLHKLVTVDEQSRPDVRGRLFATKAVDIDVVTGDTEDQGATPNSVETEIKVLIFTEGGSTTAVAAPSAGPAPMSPKTAEQQSINAITATNASGGTP